MIEAQKKFIHLPRTPDAPESAYAGAFSYWKSIVLGVVTAGTGFAASYLINGSIAATGFERTHMLAWGGVSLLFFLVLLVLDVTFINRTWMAAVVLALAGISLGMGLLGNLSTNSLIAWAIAIILILSSGFSARKALDVSLKIEFFRISNTTLKGAILAVAVIAGLVFFNIFSTQPLSGVNPIFPQSLFEGGANLVVKFIGPSLGGIDFSMSIRQIVTQLLNKQLEQNPSLKGATTPADKEQLISKAIEEYQNRLGGIIGMNINPDEKLSVALYNSLLNKINSLPGPTKNIAVLVGAVLFLLTVAAVSPIIRPIVSVIAFVFYELLLGIKFGTIVYETRSKETIVLP
jgi:hypothetical protein